MKRYYNIETKQCVVMPEGSDSGTIIISTDDRVKVAFQAIDTVKYDRANDVNGFPILKEYQLQEDGTRYTHYLEDGTPDEAKISQEVKDKRVVEIDGLLAKIDMKKVRPLSELIVESTPATVEILNGLNADAQTLRDERTSLLE